MEDIKELIEEINSRKPKDYELKLLAETYLSEAKSAYQQNISLQTPQDIMATAESLEDYGNHIQPVVEEGVTAIDPGARMLDVFNNYDKYKMKAKKQNISPKIYSKRLFKLF